MRLTKVLKIRSRGDNNWTFKCKDLDKKKNQPLTLNLSNFLEAVDKALPAMKTPKDIFFLDFDNHGQWKVVNEGELRRL